MGSHKITYCHATQLSIKDGKLTGPSQTVKRRVQQLVRVDSALEGRGGNVGQPVSLADRKYFRNHGVAEIIGENTKKSLFTCL